MRYEFVAAERVWFPVRLLCRLVGVAASAFYAWASKQASPQDEHDQALLAEIEEIFEASGSTYGSPRVHTELAARGRKIGRKRVERLMRKNGLAVPKRRKRKPFTTDSDHDLPVSPNLLGQNFKAKAPDAVWLTDITYIATDEGWLYLSGIKDMATREIVGWAPRLSPESRAFGKRMKGLLAFHGRSFAHRTLRASTDHGHPTSPAA